MVIETSDRPPYVAFSYEEVEDRPASLASGHYCSKQTVYVTISRAGSRDTVMKPVDEWFQEQKEFVRKRRTPQAWFDAYTAAYEHWKKGEEVPPNGTPIKTWPVLSPAQVKAVIQAGFLTVEDLAAAPDNGLGQIGIGALGLKQKAKAWLEQASSGGAITERLNAMETELQALRRQNAELREANQNMQIAPQTVASKLQLPSQV